MSILRQPRSGRDHDLWRLILCEALHSAAGKDRLTNSVTSDQALKQICLSLVLSAAALPTVDHKETIQKKLETEMNLSQ